jgi:MoaA/NifB/PqqE/SkfB family radical SAM enzyme
MTGGEPMVRKKDILRLLKKHRDCYFAAFSNSTLIDEEFVKELQKLGNMTFFLSIEGTPDTNDASRGEGHYAAVMKAMDLLKKYGILFGTSICYTRANIEAVTSDDFFHLLEEKGAKFGFYFHYMPVGKNAVPDLMPTPEQREYMINRIRYIRSSESDRSSSIRWISRTTASM